MKTFQEIYLETYKGQVTADGLIVAKLLDEANAQIGAAEENAENDKK